MSMSKNDRVCIYKSDCCPKVKLSSRENIINYHSILSAKWSSNEDVSSFGRGGRGGGSSGSGADSPFLKADKRRDFKPINFDSNSLKRNKSGKENVSGNSQVCEKAQFRFT